MTNLEWLIEQIEENRKVDTRMTYSNQSVEHQKLITQQIIAKEFIKLNENLLKIKHILVK